MGAQYESCVTEYAKRTWGWNESALIATAKFCWRSCADRTPAYAARSITTVRRVKNERLA